MSMANSTTSKEPRPLPAPEERPNAAIIIFDGQCGFCRGQVERLSRWDRTKSLAFLSLHDSEVSKRFPDLTFNQLMDQMYLVDISGNRHGGAAAFRYLSRKLPRLWFLAPLMHIPGSLSIWQWLYRKIASRRYRLSDQSNCDESNCKVHF